jgi:hypothetical protein
MFDALRKLVGNRTPLERAWAELPRWAKAKGWQWRGVSPDEGFLIEPTGREPSSVPVSPPWRIEWGTAQRTYFDGFELRLRAELPVPPNLQIAVFDRALHARLEQAVFEEFVGDLHTRIDARTPPEMRWLVMLAKVPSQQVGVLRRAAAAVASDPAWAQQWLGGVLSAALMQELAGAADAEAAANAPEAGDTGPTAAGGARSMVLTLSRGRLTLRTPLPVPDVASLERFKGLFDRAVDQAVKQALAVRSPS